MKHRFKTWFRQLVKSIFRRFKAFMIRFEVSQQVSGNKNQTIGKMEGNSTAIANVETLIQYFHLWPQEILSLQSFWTNWSQETTPPFIPKLVIGGRNQARDSILSWLRGSPSPFTLQGDSLEETIAFLAAVIQGLEMEERTKVLSRAVVVNSATAWQSLITSSEPLILIVRLKEPEGIGAATQQGHHIFIPSGRVSSDSGDLLPRIVRDAAEQTLSEMGLSHDKSRNLAILARRSLSALRRKLAIARNIQQPDWAKPQEARVLMAPLLVSAWNNSCEGDRDALARISGLPYETLQTHLVRWVNAPDPPLRKVGDIWMIASQEDAWRLIAYYLTDSELKRFEDVALDILSEIDPAFDLPSEQRFAAAIYRKVLSYSGTLRNGISETLALMATLSSETAFNANQNGESIARKVVCKLLENAKKSEMLWASLANQLPLIAEAAPNTFLEAVNYGLSGDNPALVGLFQDNAESSSWMSSSPHTHLLWSLETLAWSPEYFSQAALLLARLSRLDPGGRLVNRPIRSLHAIFTCWYPQTGATLESRLRVLDKLRKQEPELSWQLLMTLLPRHHDTATPTHGTKWRDWIPDITERATREDYLTAVNKILSWLISDSGGNSTRWCSLILAISGLSIERQRNILDALEQLDPETFSLEDQVIIYDCLRRQAVRHREYAETDWAMPANHIDRLEIVLTRFQPQSLIYRYRWYFTYNLNLPGKRNASWEEREQAIGKLQTKALQEILASQGWNGVLELAQQVKQPCFIGVSLARSDLLPINLDQFLRENFWSDEQWRCEMAGSYVSFKSHNQGEEWVKACLNSNLDMWSASEYGAFLLCLPFNVHLLDRLLNANPETQRYFWQHTQRINFLGRDHITLILKKLVEFERPYLAIQEIHRALEEHPGWVSPEQISEILEICIRTQPPQSFDFGSFAYHSSELMNYLAVSNLSRERLANLELLYFRVHDHYRHSQTIFDELSHNPKFFVEVLQCLFGTENVSKVKIDEDTDGSSDPEDIAEGTIGYSLANSAWHLLEKWRQMPGMSEDGSVDAAALRTWVIRVRELAAECNRSKTANIYIGHALAFSPPDPDGAWPHQSVRDLIEDMASPKIEQGLCTQVFNNRGVTTRFLTDGGVQERKLVEQYEGYVEQIRDQWPRTAAVLRNIANRYRQQATCEDVDAELTQDF